MPAGGRAPGLRALPDPVGPVLHPVEHLDEDDADHRRRGAEGDEQRVAGNRAALDPGEREEGVGAEGRPADHVGGHRGQGDGAEGAGLEVEQDHLEGKEDAGDRRVEGRRDAGRGAAGDQQPHPRHPRPRQLPEGRPQRRADLHDRALAADRAAGADAKRRGQRLDHRRPPAGFDRRAWRPRTSPPGRRARAPRARSDRPAVRREGRRRSASAAGRRCRGRGPGG